MSLPQQEIALENNKTLSHTSCIWLKKKITIYFNYLTMKCLSNKSNMKKSFPANHCNKINEGQAQL